MRMFRYELRINLCCVNGTAERRGSRIWVVERRFKARTRLKSYGRTATYA